MKVSSRAIFFPAAAAIYNSNNACLLYSSSGSRDSCLIAYGFISMRGLSFIFKESNEQTLISYNGSPDSTLILLISFSFVLSFLIFCSSTFLSNRWVNFYFLSSIFSICLVMKGSILPSNFSRRMSVGSSRHIWISLLATETIVLYDLSWFVGVLLYPSESKCMSPSGV